MPEDFGLHHNPAQHKTRRAWGKITDRELVAFSMTHFNDHGDCTLSDEWFARRSNRPLLEAMIYHRHARFMMGVHRHTLCLVGRMLNLRSSKAMFEQFGLVALQHQPHTSAYFRPKAIFR